MTFHSLTFAIFFAVVVALYYRAPEARRVPLLLAASVLFYVSFIPQYIFILAALITIDYFAARLIEAAESARLRKAWLILSLASNLGLMFAFKYTPDLFGRSLGAVPVGLSFHTFQAMAYTIEVYRGRHPAERSFAVYALYVMFFPQIAAGPIERPQDLLPQFRKPHAFDYAGVVGGLQLMLWGMFQKYVVADRLAVVVNEMYSSPDHFSGPAAVFTAACFAFQMFCDFAGYSEIALGAAQVLGIRLSRNFNNPFHSDSMAEYWKRWHMSFSSWMRDYVFFPLCGRRPRMWRVSASIMVVFLLNGIWHGARWNYAISGLLHGAYRVTELLAGRAFSKKDWHLPAALATPMRIVRTTVVFALMTFAFLFFRGDNLHQTLHVVSRMFTGWNGVRSAVGIKALIAATGMGTLAFARLAVLIAIVEIVQLLREAGPLRPRIAALPATWRWGLYYAAAAAVFLLAAPPQSFIYFQF